MSTFEKTPGPDAGPGRIKGSGGADIDPLKPRFRILILSALRQEYAPLRKLFPSWHTVQRKPPKKFAFSLSGKEIVLVESGMGEKSLKEALGAELAEFAPDLLIFSGFAGGLHPDLPVGTVCFAVSAREISSEVAFHFRFPDELVHFMAQNHIRPVLALGVKAPGNKQTLSSLAAGQTAVVDMETAAAAQIAWHERIPFICFRAVSDAVDHDLGFDLSDIVDEHGRIKPSGVFAAIVRRPAALRAFYLSWRRSRRAARNLCRSVGAFLGVPAFALDGMAGQIRIERERPGRLL